MPEDTNVLRLPAFRRLLCGRVAATLAGQIQAVVVGWQLYTRTNDPLTLGWVGLAQFVPLALLVLPAGDLADRFDRRKVLAVSWLLQAGAAACFFALTLLDQAPLLAYYAVLMVFGAGRALAGPAQQSLLPQVVGERLLGRAVAWNASFFQIAIVAGPALGGFLYLFGPAAGYGICLALFLFAAAAAAGLRVIPRQREHFPGGAWQRFTAGLIFVRGHPQILGVITLDLFAVLLGSVTALLPVYAHEILHVGPVGLGGLRSALALGAFAIGIYLGRRPLARHNGPALFASVVAFGLAILVFAVSSNYWLSFAALALAGGVDMVSVFVRATLVQLATPDAMRGRVSAVNSLCISASNELGEFESGAVAAWLGAVPAAIVGAFGTLAVAGLWWRWFPALRRIDRLEARL